MVAGVAASYPDMLNLAMGLFEGVPLLFFLQDIASAITDTKTSTDVFIVFSFFSEHKYNQSFSHSKKYSINGNCYNFFIPDAARKENTSDSLSFKGTILFYSAAL